ncbi:uncharacterized protein LOC142162138 [Nicotiana tabacum]|uniref:Uncharacterized protein LOC142162138 n=1 Tax=Nicotiana tabacum TaxID=4097 RepID=A0AC58RP88_TOBAC
MHELEKWSTIEERILRQKSRVTWIDYGDSNSKYFYAQLKIRASKNNITTVYNDIGVKITDPKAVEKEFTNFFTQLMGKDTRLKPCPNTRFIKVGDCLTLHHQHELIKEITHEEVDEPVKDMPNDKAPGFDDYPIKFFTKHWTTVRQEIYEAVSFFFHTGKASMELIIAKILTKRIKRVIEVIIGKSQSAFIEGRSIINNILFSHELFNGYNRKGLSLRADTTSIKIMQEAFNKFSIASGLQANADKSSMYIAGVPQHIKELLLDLTGFIEGYIPFKYLGVPLSATKLNIHQCLSLVERITEKINCWLARMLSYSGRIQLIKSVLFGIQTYWAQIFLLPKKIMKMIETICMTFLWTGSNAISRKALITWDKICQPKATGGLNIINMRIWNKAAILKHLWALTMKKDALWIKWTHNYYIKTLQKWTHLRQ